MKNVLLGFILLLPFQTTSWASDQGQLNMLNPHKQLESAASAASETRGGDPNAIDNLTKAVLMCPHFFHLPDEISSLLSTELTQAEKKYRNKTGKGVTEAQIVDSMNLIGKALKTPEYARTTSKQVRALRMAMMIQSPVFMGEGLSTQNIKKGESIEAPLSPLQALHLLSTLIDQKLVNEDYADASTDTVALVHERRRKAEALSKASPGAKSHVLSIEPTSLKSREIRQASMSGISAMSINDSLALANRLLSTIGLK